MENDILSHFSLPLYILLGYFCWGCNAQTLCRARDRERIPYSTRKAIQFTLSLKQGLLLCVDHDTGHDHFPNAREGQARVGIEYEKTKLARTRRA